MPAAAPAAPDRGAAYNTLPPGWSALTAPDGRLYYVSPLVRLNSPAAPEQRCNTGTGLTPASWRLDRVPRSGNRREDKGQRVVYALDNTQSMNLPLSHNYCHGHCRTKPIRRPIQTKQRVVACPVRRCGLGGRRCAARGARSASALSPWPDDTPSMPSMPSMPAMPAI